MNPLMFQVIFWDFLFRQANYWEITRELMGNYRGINIIFPSGIEIIVFELISPYFLTPFFVTSL